MRYNKRLSGVIQRALASKGAGGPAGIGGSDGPELAYGLLRLTQMKPDDPHKRHIETARKALAATLGAERRMRGLNLAKDWLAENPAQLGGAE